MEHRPSINGPSDPTLGGITQLESHSDISTLYPTAKAQWDGEIMTPEARNAKKKAEREAVIMSIRGKFLAIGLLLPLPFFVAATIIAIIFSVVSAFYYLRIIKIIYFDKPKDVINLDDSLAIKAIIIFSTILNFAMLFFIENIFALLNGFML